MVLISPHYDDLLLSLPGRLRDWARRGEGVLAVVVFSQESEAMTAACEALFAKLRVSVRPLGLDDAGRRGLAGHALLDPGGWRRGQLADAVAHSVAERLEAALADASTEILLRPCIPTQIDHALTLAALGRIGRLDTPCYADQPYAFKWPATLARETLGRHPVPGPIHDPEDAQCLASLAPLTPEFDMARLIRRRIQAGAMAEPIFMARGVASVPPAAPAQESAAARL